MIIIIGMCKKKFVPVRMRQRGYRIFLDDVKEVHRKKRKPTPPVPNFSYSSVEQSKTDIQIMKLKSSIK